MGYHLNDDCWTIILDFVQYDHHSLFQLLQVNKFFFHTVVPRLYRRPLLDYPDLKDHGRDLEWQLMYEFNLKHSDFKPLTVDNSTGITADAPTTTTASTTPISLSIDYCTLVSEMPDRSVISNTTAHADAYYQAFGSKIQKFTVIPWIDWDRFKELVPLLSNMRELVVNRDPDQHMALMTPPFTTPTVYEIMTEILKLHQRLFPGKLEQISYWSLKSESTETNSDPKMMMCIRDAMSGDGDGGGGRWYTDNAVFWIPMDRDPILLEVLQDVELPTQLRSLKIIQSSIHLSDHWIEPLALFLSRCRVLDNVHFHESMPELFSWAVEEQQGLIATGAVATTSTATSSEPQTDTAPNVGKYQIKHYNDRFSLTKTPVQWRSIHFDLMTFPSHWYSEAQLEQCRKIWDKILIGFGHGIETFRFTLLHWNDSHVTEYPILKFPDSIRLPKIQELDLTCPRFAKLNFSELEQIQKLSLKVVRLELDVDGKWRDWRRWKNVRNLVLEDRSGWNLYVVFPEIGHEPDNEVVVLSSSSSPSVAATNRLPADVMECGVPTTENKEQPKARDQRSIIVTRNDTLENLKTVRIVKMSPRLLNPNVLLVGPNITNMSFVGDTNNEAMDWTGFFENAIDNALVFPYLERLTIEALVRLKPAWLGQLLSVSQDGFDMFPALKFLSLGPISDKEGQELAIIPFQQVIQQGFMSQRGVHREMVFKRTGLNRRAHVRWRTWIETMGFEANRENKKWPGFAFRFTSWDVLFQRRSAQQ